MEPAGPITLDQLRGHSKIVQPARLVWALDVPDPGTPLRKRLAVIKSNLSRFPDPIGIASIEDSGVQFGTAPTEPRQESLLDRACELLLTLLHNGPVLVADLEKEQKGAGMSWDTFKRAKERLGIVARRDGHARAWLWALPARGEE